MSKIILILSIVVLNGMSMQAMDDRIAYSPPPRLKESDSALLKAINGNDEQKAIAAIEAGANVNQITHFGDSFLKRAADRGQLDLVRILLKADAEDTTSALLAAAVNNKFEVVKLLLQYNADVYAKNSDLQTSLVLAIRSYAPNSLWQFNTVKVILQHLIQLTLDEKNLLRNWLLVDQRLRAEGRGLPRDLKKPIAGWIIRALAQEVQARIIRAGGLEALQEAKNKNDPKLIKLLEDFLNLDSLETAIFKQQTLKNL